MSTTSDNIPKSANVKALNALLCSIYIPFEGADMIIDLDDPNSIFQLARLICSCSDLELLSCASRWKANQERGFEENSMILAMCGLGFPMSSSKEENMNEEAECLFCSSTVFPKSFDIGSVDSSNLVSLVKGHHPNCPYRWFLTQERVKPTTMKPLSPENGDLLSYLQTEMKKMVDANQFGFSSDVICTALAKQFLTNGYKTKNSEFADDFGFIDIDYLMNILAECDVPTIPGIAAHVSSFDKDEFEKPEYRVWPRIKARYHRANYYLRQVILLPRVREEVEVTEG